MIKNMKLTVGGAPVKSKTKKVEKPVKVEEKKKKK